MPCSARTVINGAMNARPKTEANVLRNWEIFGMGVVKRIFHK